MKSLLQTKKWADFRVSQGWEAHNIDGISILERKLPMGKSFLYAPEVTWDTITKYENFYENTKKSYLTSRIKRDVCVSIKFFIFKIIN